MARLIEDSRLERTITLELSEKDLATLVSAIGTSNIEDMRKFCLANSVSIERMHNFYDARDLFTSLYKVLKSE